MVACVCRDYYIYACFRFDATQREMSVDMIEKSDSDTLSIWNQDDYCWPLGKSQISPCQESFIKWTSEEMKPQREIKGDLLFPLTIYLLLHFPLFFTLVTIFYTCQRLPPARRSCGC